MALTADLLTQFELRDADDRRRVTYTYTDKSVTELVWHRLDVAGTATVQINLGGLSTNTGPKTVWVSGDKQLCINFVTVHAGSNLTAMANFGNEIVANGIYVASLTNTTALWITNRSTQTAIVEIAVAKTA